MRGFWWLWALGALSVRLAAQGGETRESWTQEWLDFKNWRVELGTGTGTESVDSRTHEISVGGVSYGGIAVQAVKVRNPLQLISPFAPLSYGRAEANVTRDTSNRVSGLRLFSLRF